MCIGGTSTEVPEKVPEAPQLPDASGVSGDADKKRRAAAAGNDSGTILTSARGVTQQGTTATKTLLGE